MKRIAVRLLGAAAIVAGAFSAGVAVSQAGVVPRLATAFDVMAGSFVPACPWSDGTVEADPRFGPGEADAQPAGPWCRLH